MSSNSVISFEITFSLLCYLRLHSYLDIFERSLKTVNTFLPDTGFEIDSPLQ